MTTHPHVAVPRRALCIQLYQDGLRPAVHQQDEKIVNSMDSMNISKFYVSSTNTVTHSIGTAYLPDGHARKRASRIRMQTRRGKRRYGRACWNEDGREATASRERIRFATASLHQYLSSDNNNPTDPSPTVGATGTPPAPPRPSSPFSSPPAPPPTPPSSPASWPP